MPVEVRSVFCSMQAFVLLVCALLEARGISRNTDFEAIRLVDPIWRDNITQTRLFNDTHPPPPAPPRQTILCRSSSDDSSVTVIQQGSIRVSPRSLRFTRSPESAYEGYVVCKEPCDTMSHEVQRAAECQGCPCTVVKPYENLFGYDRPPVDHVAKRYTRDQTPYNILVVGLGAGGMIDAIRAVCDVRMVHIIEANENVVHANLLYFGLNASVVTSKEEALTDNPGTHIFQGDGEHGVQVMAQKFSNKFDTMIVDCMAAGTIPPGCKSDAFYSSVRKLLKPSAYIYQWTWPHQTHDVEVGIGKHIGASSLMAGWVSAAKG